MSEAARRLRSACVPLTRAQKEGRYPLSVAQQSALGAPGEGVDASLRAGGALGLTRAERTGQRPFDPTLDQQEALELAEI